MNRWLLGADEVTKQVLHDALGLFDTGRSVQ